jgi:hypothetical protein
MGAFNQHTIIGFLRRFMVLNYDLTNKHGDLMGFGAEL